ncbi:uncharacterized protein LOC129224865 [Uloborus diversus]|uniref:uncharacterized protein LOC129224865 n=1 Tax=Uloborus diversus TaxID=327109 RepID=UPI00240A113C|nr:uncharacterized protein LOC129224865 [Uloborus diversus]
MSKKLGCSKRIQGIDIKIHECLSDISNLFGKIENLDAEDLQIINTDDLDSEKLCNILQDLDSLLLNSPNTANYLFPHFGEIRKQNNIALFDKDFSEIEFGENGDNSKIYKLWKNICVTVNSYSISFIFQNLFPLSSLHSLHNLCQLKKHVNLLSNIFIPELVWKKYKCFRSKYLEQFICACKTDQACFKCTLDLSIECMHQDMLLISTGCFYPFVITQNDIFEIYIKIIDQKFYNVMKFLLNITTEFVLATDSPDQSPFHDTISASSNKTDDSVSRLSSWNWRYIMAESGCISELQKSLQNNVECVIRIFLKKEKEIFIAKQWKDLLDFENKYDFCSDTVQTNSLLTSVKNCIEILESYVPVLIAFVPFKSSFCHALETYVVDLIRHLRFIALEHPDGFSMYFLYLALSNAIFLKDQLQYYCKILKKNDVPGHNYHETNVCHESKKLVDDLEEMLYLHHNRYLSNGILFDADSYNFEDQKPFFEGERISYSIQMWYMYMLGVIHDLKFFMPLNVAQEIYADLLSNSLDTFLIRYGRACPSEMRTPQVMTDLYAILLCASELLYTACTSDSQILGTNKDKDENNIALAVYKMHSTCSCLLSVLGVLTSPISELYNVFKDGFPQPCLSLRTKCESVASWISWIRRDLYTEYGQSKILSSVSVWLSVEICTSWSVASAPAIVKAYLDHHCTLSILLMMQNAEYTEDFKETNDLSSCYLDNCKVKFAYHIFKLIFCHDNDAYLYDILFPVIEKTSTWEELHSSYLNKTLSEPLINCVVMFKKKEKNIFNGNCFSLLEEQIPFWAEIKSLSFDSHALEGWARIKDNLKEFIICVCDSNLLNSFQDDFKISHEIISFLCVKKILDCIKKMILFLPKSLKRCLACLDQHIMHYMPEIQPIQNSVPLQILISNVITCLMENSFIDIASKTIQDMPFITANALKLLKDDFFFMSDHKTKRIKSLLKLIHEEFDDLSKDLEENKRSAYFEEIQDEVLALSAHELTKNSSGTNSITYLHQILCQNKSWIQSSLGIPGMLSPNMVVSSISPSPLLKKLSENFNLTANEKKLVASAQKETSLDVNEHHLEKNSQGESFESEQSLMNKLEDKAWSTFAFNNPAYSEKENFNLKIKLAPSTDFNFDPLKKFDTIGESTFNKLVLEQNILPWEALLSHLPVLGLTEVNFSSLLSHRWDIQSDKHLSTDEAKYAEQLKAVHKCI